MLVHRKKIIKGVLENYLPLSLCDLLGYSEYYFSGKLENVFDKHRSPVECVVGLDGSRIVSGSKQALSFEWNYITSEVIKQIPLPMSHLSVIDGNQFVSSFGRTITINGRFSFLTNHGDDISCLGVLRSGDVVSGSKDGSLKVWNIETLQLEKTIEKQGRSDEVECLVILDDDRFISSYQNMTRIWKKEKSLIEYIGNYGDITCMISLPDGRIVYGFSCGIIKISNLNLVYRGHYERVNCFGILPDGRLISGSNDRTIRVWNLITNTCDATIYQSNKVTCLTVLPNGWVASGSYKKIIVWS